MQRSIYTYMSVYIFIRLCNTLRAHPTQLKVLNIKEKHWRWVKANKSKCCWCFRWRYLAFAHKSCSKLNFNVASGKLLRATTPFVICLLYLQHFANKFNAKTLEQTAAHTDANTHTLKCQLTHVPHLQLHMRAHSCLNLVLCFCCDFARKAYKREYPGFMMR